MNKLPKATHQGVLKIGDVEMPCFNLEDGRRVISGRGMTKAIGMKGRGQGVARIVTHSTLKPFISNDLDLAIRSPVHFVGAGSRKGKPNAGYEATVLHDLCQADARSADALKTDIEKRYATFCEVLVRSFAKVGIIALVDEATGYQYDRDQKELETILEAYIAKELLPWTKRFPDEFYRQLFRLRGWQYSPLTVKKPKYVGKLTNQLIYKKLPQGVLEELREKNPVTHRGYRKHRHHQFLTEGIGNPHLERHIASVTTLMRVSANWRNFERLFQRAFSDTPEQLDFNFLEETEEPKSRTSCHLINPKYGIFRNFIMSPFFSSVVRSLRSSTP